MKSFKKVLSIMLAVVLVSSVCTCLMTTASAYTVDGTETESAPFGQTFVYDWKDENGTWMTAYGSEMTDYNFGTDGASAHPNCHCWFSYSDSARADVFGSGSVAQSFVKEGEGVVLVTNGLAKSMSTSTGSWSTKLYLKDPDFKLGDTNREAGREGFLRMEAGNYYKVEAYVKSYTGTAVDGITQVSNSANFQAGICISATNSGGSNSTVATVASQVVDYQKTDATVITAVLDADDTSWKGVTSTNTFQQTNVGRYIGITVQSNTYALIEKVVVTVYTKENLATASKGFSSVDMENGWEDMYFPNGNAMNLGPIDIVDDPTNAGQGKVFNFKSEGRMNSTMSYGIAADANLGGYGSVDIMAQGFQVEAGHRYKISFKAYMSSACETNFPGNFGVYQSTKAAVSKYIAGEKTGVTSTAVGDTAYMSKIKERVGTGVWTDVALEFVTDSAALDKGQSYLLLTHGVNVKEDGAEWQYDLYLDDITVVDITTNVGERTEGVKRSIRAASGTGDAYVSAGLRFRGELNTAAVAGKEVGFIVAPADYANSFGGKWYEITDGKAALDSAKVVSCTDKVYGTNGENTQYQMIITKLTKEGETKNLLATEFNVKMYVKDGDSYTYYDVAISSYNQVKIAYALNDESTWDKY